MIRIISAKRLKDLERKERKLHVTNRTILELMEWCAYDSPEIAFAMLFLIGQKRESVDRFRENLRQKMFTFENFKKKRIIKKDLDL